MTTCDRRGGGSTDAGFTLLEVVVVLGVLGLLLGAAMPLAGAVVEADRRQEATRELAELCTALESYCYEHAAFPASLTATDFLGVHLQPGVAGTATTDPFGAGAAYVYAIDAATNSASVRSRGENGIDDGLAAEQLVGRVFAAVPGTKKTHARLRLIAELLANHVEAGGSVAGTWPSLRATLSLGAAYDQDGFGTVLQWTAATHTLTSAGPDRTFGTGDDITL